MLIRLVLTEIQAFKNERNLQRNVWKCGQIQTLSELSSRKQKEGWRIWLAKWCKIHKVYIYSHSTTKFTFKKYIYSHLRDVFIHIQWVIFVHIHNQNVHSPFSAHHLCASLGPSTRSIISAQCNVADRPNTRVTLVGSFYCSSLFPRLDFPVLENATIKIPGLSSFSRTHRLQNTKHFNELFFIRVKQDDLWWRRDCFVSCGQKLAQMLRILEYMG